MLGVTTFPAALPARSALWAKPEMALNNTDNFGIAHSPTQEIELQGRSLSDARHNDAQTQTNYKTVKGAPTAGVPGNKHTIRNSR